MRDDRCYFEMNETEAELKHMQDTLEFLHYAISTGKPFPIEQHKDYAKTQKINDLCEAIGNNLNDAMKNMDKLMEICKVENEEPAEKDKDCAEMLQEISDNPQRFLHEVDCAESVDILTNGKIVDISDMQFDGKEAVSIKVETTDGQLVEMINTGNGLLCSGWKEV